MPQSRGGRSARHSHRVGTKPYSGRRFVQDGAVRVEWFPLGRRKILTIGPNTPANRTYADQVLEDALKRARQESMGLIEQAPITLRELMQRHLDDGKLRRNKKTGAPLRDPTFTNYQGHVVALQRELASCLDRQALALHKTEVREAIHGMRKRHLSEKTIAGHIDYLKQVYRWAVGTVELLATNPIAAVEVPSRKGTAGMYSLDEGHRLLDAMRRLPQAAWRFRCLILLEAAYSPRANQGIRLRWSDVDFDTHVVGTPCQGTITFRQDTCGSKGQPDRVVPMLPPVREALLDAWSRRKDDQGWVLWSWRDGSKPVRYDSMHHSLERLEKAAQVQHQPYRAFHAFRRALLTALTEQLGPKQAADWVGDTVAVVVRNYVKPTQEAVAQVARHLGGSAANRGATASPKARGIGNA